MYSQNNELKCQSNMDNILIYEIPIVYLGIFAFIIQLFRHRTFKYTKHGNLKKVGIKVRIIIQIKHDSL